MNVAFDISALGIGHRHESGRSGIFRVVDELARRLVGSPDCNVTFVASASFETLRDSIHYLDSGPAFRRVAIARPRFLELHVRLERALRLMNTPQSGSPALAAAKHAACRAVALTGSLFGAGSGPLDVRALSSADIYHSPEFPLQPSSGRAQRVLTCYDLIPIRHPEFVLSSHRAFAEEILRSVRPSDWVICISEEVRNDLCDYLGFEPHRTFVTHLAADPTLFYREADEGVIGRLRLKYGIPDGPYLLSLATLEPRRNIRHLVKCFATLVNEEHVDDLSLALVGHNGWGLDDLFEAVGRDESIRRKIVFTGYACDEDLAPLYSGALAFVYPSLCEGFGLTPLEAMQCGAPVITSNVSSLPEVVGDAAIQVDPSDAAGLCENILTLYRNETLRKCLAVKSLARAKQFSWDKCARETIEAYRVAVNGRN
jgi:glycosyltransferase involved in cell wall biosynthesis